MKKMYRSKTNRVWLGVLGGIGQYFHIDATVLRIIFVVALLVTGIFPLGIAYLVAYFLMPEAPDSYIDLEHK